MPYSGRACAGGSTTIFKGPRLRVEPLCKIGRPPWRKKTVQDFEKIFLLAYDGIGLLRSC